MHISLQKKIWMGEIWRNHQTATTLGAFPRNSDVKYYNDINDTYHNNVYSIHLLTI
jgi:hypothetical protein